MHGQGKKPRGLRDRARAAVVPLVACCMLLIMAVAALAVDASGAYRARAAQQQTMELAKDSALSSLNYLKFADDPAAATASCVGDALAAEKFTGTATITYHELPESQTGSSDRVAGVYVKLEGTYKTTFSHTLGVSEMPVASEIAWTTNPYSDTVVFRPSVPVQNRTYKVKYEAGAGTLLSSAAAPELLGEPEALRRALTEALGHLGG